MSLEIADRVAAAVLYEGYMLYPYRPSSLKNHKRWTFGGLYARESCHAGEAWSQQTECLVRGEGQTRVHVRVRFLHLLANAQPDGAWPEAIEREVGVAPGRLDALRDAREIPFEFGSPIGDEDGTRAIRGRIELRAVPVDGGAFRLTVAIENHTPGRYATDVERDRRVLVATHTLLGVESGEFVSLLEPPEELEAAASGCRNLGTWPVLVGPPGSRDTMLSSPIILYDYPTIAPESPGDFFDSTDMDEMLTLRILTLTDDEKREMREADPRSRALLDRIEALGPEARLRLHGAIREWKPSAASDGAGRSLRAGDRVRLRPRGRGDVFDIALDGRAATITSVEQDFEGRVLLAVTVDDDPGRDLGERGEPGHRFFFAPADVEPL